MLGACGPGLQLPGQVRKPSPEDRREAMQYFIKAKAYEAQGNHFGAIVALRNAADLDSTSPTIFERLAVNYRRADDPRMAIHFARRGLAMDPARVELRHMLVRMLEANGDRAAAALELERLLEYEPADWRVYRRLAYLYVESGQPDRVKPLFDRLLERGDVSPQIRADLAGVLVRTENYDRAEELYRQLIREHPSVEEAWLGLTELLLKRGRRNEAMELYREAMSHMTESTSVPYYLARLIATEHDLDAMIAQEPPDFLYRLGVALSEAGKFAEAATVFEGIVGMQPGTVEEWLNLARHYVHLEEYQRADSLLAQAVAAMPDSTDLYLFWGTVLESAGQYDDAMAVYERGMQHDTDTRELYLFRGLALEAQEKWHKARTLYAEALEAFPDDSEFRVRLGLALARQERWQEAIAQYRSALALEPRASDAHLYWGLALQHQERWDEAVARLECAVELDSTTTHALFYLGACLEQAARKTGSEDYFQRAAATFEELLALNPEDAYALNYLGYMYANAGVRLGEAVTLLQQAVALQPDNGAFLDSLGWAHYKLGQLERADELLRIALENLGSGYGVEERAVIMEHAGDIARALGRNEEARAQWESVLELTPDNTAVRRKLDKLAP